MGNTGLAKGPNPIQPSKPIAAMLMGYVAHPVVGGCHRALLQVIEHWFPFRGAALWLHWHWKIGYDCAVRGANIS